MSYKVRITGPGGKVTFEASAPLAESRQANYDGYNIIHLPTSLVAYRNTDGRRFSIAGKLVSRTPDEAAQNILHLDLIRSWILPDFGSTGATPPILRIFGYNNFNLDNRQVVLRSYSWNFPEDVDYIWEGGEAMPVIGILQVDLEEVYSAEQVTAGAWKIDVGGGGSFAGGSSGNSSSTSQDFAASALHAQGAGIFAPGSVTSIASAIENGVKPTVPGMILGALTRNLGGKILSNPKVQEVVRGLPPVVGNIFVAGGNVLIGQAGKTVSDTVSRATTPAPANTYGRNDSPAPPTFIES
jgi:hypothetical protein